MSKPGGREGRAISAVYTGRGGSLGSMEQGKPAPNGGGALPTRYRHSDAIVFFPRKCSRQNGSSVSVKSVHGMVSAVAPVRSLAMACLHWPQHFSCICSAPLWP